MRNVRVLIEFYVRNLLAFKEITSRVERLRKKGLVLRGTIWF